MKTKLIALMAALVLIAFTGCENLMTDSTENEDESQRFSRLVVVNGTDVVLLSVQMRVTGTASWGNDLLDQWTPTGNIPAGGTCVIENIPFGTYDMYAYCYGNYYRYNVTFDTVEGKEWGFY